MNGYDYEQVGNWIKPSHIMTTWHLVMALGFSLIISFGNKMISTAKHMK